MTKEEHILVEIDEMDMRGMQDCSAYHRAHVRLHWQRLADATSKRIDHELSRLRRRIYKAFTNYYT
jgi:hypothetical protein